MKNFVQYFIQYFIGILLLVLGCFAVEKLGAPLTGMAVAVSGAAICIVTFLESHD